MPLEGSKPIECRICQDGGRVHPLKENGQPDYSRSVPCLCQKAKLEQERQMAFLKLCELPVDSENRTLEDFKTPDKGLIKMLTGANDLLAGRITWLTLLGDVNRGKTHLAIGICHKWLAMDKPAKYAFVPILLDELRAGFQNKSGENSYDNRFEFYKTVSLLALDDLGAEVRTAWAVEKLETIIDYRYINRLSTVITANMSMEEFTPRIRSRIDRMEGSRIIGITSPEYSKIKKAGK